MMQHYSYSLSCCILFSLLHHSEIVVVKGRVGDSYTGSTAIEEDGEEWDGTDRHKEQECGIFYGISIVDPESYELYVTREYTGVLTEDDLVVPIINANKNEYSPWHDFVWNEEFIPHHIRSLEHRHNGIINNNITINTQEYFVAGITAIAPCTSSPNNNVRPNYDALMYNSTNSGDNGTSWYRNYIIETTGTLQPGQMIVNECASYDIPENAKELVHPNIDALRTDEGICMDSLQIRPSTLPDIGRGAFAKHRVPRGHIVATSPVIHFDRSQMYIVPQAIILDENEHTIPSIYRSHNIEYNGSKAILGQQMLLNYCYGHPLSNLLLLPYGPGVNFINHQSDENANVMIRWSETKMTASSTHFRTNTPVLEMYEQPAGTTATNIMIEFVAIKDILPGDEIFLNYGEAFSEAWDEHVRQVSSSQPLQPFRHEIGVPDGFYNERWMRADPNPLGDFIASPLAPGHMAPIRWKGSADIVTPWAFRIGLPSRVRKVLLNYCNKMGITDILRHVTVDGNGLLPGMSTHMELEGDDWYLQRPDGYWRSNLHWFSPGAGPAHEHYLQALSVAGFDTVLQGIGEYLGMDGLVAFHVTFIAGSYSNLGFMHNDVFDTGGKVYNIIIPLLLANETGPELDLQSWKAAILTSCRYR